MVTKAFVLLCAAVLCLPSYAFSSPVRKRFDMKFISNLTLRWAVPVILGSVMDTGSVSYFTDFMLPVIFEPYGLDDCFVARDAEIGNYTGVIAAMISKVS